MQPYIVCRIRVAGFHRWEGAPATVSFLANRHRHLFGVTVRLLVGGINRAVEFYMFQRELRACLAELYDQRVDGFEFGERSCEMIATDLVEWLQLNGYMGQVHSVEVDEDGENGGGVWI